MADTHGANDEDGVELTSAPSAARPRRRMLALWGVLAVLVFGAGAIVVHSRNTDPPRLPIALGAAPGATRAAAPTSTAAADVAMAPYATYVAGADLPVLGGSGPAYRLPGAVSASDANALARALGLAGSPTRTGTGWQLAGDQGVLEISGAGGGSWWFSSTAMAANGSSGGGVASGSGVSGPGTAIAVPTTVPANTSQPAPPAPADKPIPAHSVPNAVPPAIACAPDHPCTDPGFVPPPVTPPADLPSKAEARRIALDLLAATGFEVRDADVTVEGPQPVWYVSVAPHLDGQLVSGLVASVVVGSKGKVTDASGYLGHPQRLGSYPLIDTRAAIARLNAQGSTGFGASPLERSSPASTTSVIYPSGDVRSGTTTMVLPPVAAPPPPVPPPTPARIVLHRADPILMLVPASDGSGDLYLVRGYRFHGDGDTRVDATAISDGALAPVSGACARPGADTLPCPPEAVRPMGEAK